MSETAAGPAKPAWYLAFTSWRVGAIALLSFSSGVPYGVASLTMLVWLKQVGFDAKTIGFITLAQLPYGFKFLWSPLLDRVRLPFLGRRRGWIVVCQVLLSVLFGVFAMNALAPPVALAATLMFLICFVSSSQDIVYDAYAVEVLKREEHGAAVGIRSGLYIAGMRLAGNLAITLSGVWGWKPTLFMLSGIILVLVPVSVFAPEPVLPVQPPKTLRAAVWEPFVGFLGRPRALEITAFVTLYRMADSLAGALVGPFLVERGYDMVQVGVFRGVIDFAGNLLGTVLGGIMAARLGLSRSLWIGGFLLVFSNAGYAVVASVPPSMWVLGPALIVETACGGLAWGAFGVLLLRLTDKRFSATQYALFSSLVGLTRTLMGPVAGVLVDAVQWRNFFLISMAAGIPGLLLLRRFAPWGTEPQALSEEIPETNPVGVPWPKSTLWGAGIVAWLTGAAIAVTLSSLMTAVKHARAGTGFDFGDVLRATLVPTTGADAVGLGGALVFGLLFGVATAAYLAARGKRSTSP